LICPAIIFLLGVVGVLVAVAIDQSMISFEGITYVSPAIAFIIGCAGGDFLDGIYKILLKKAE
jgi:hypothetical protein